MTSIMWAELRLLRRASLMRLDVEAAFFWWPGSGADGVVMPGEEGGWGEPS